ncbi:flagellar basal-body MS-ring/collar protein FliF [Desulfolithobacter sp.]
MAEDTGTPPQAENGTAPQTGWQVLVHRIRQWPMPRKLALVAVALISIALFTVIIIQARTADYQLLFANLNETDAASVVEWLKSNNVPYQLKNGGKSIWVPMDKVHEARLSLTAAGLPQGTGVGFEIFDKQSFALTDFVQKVNYTRALQGELARTIASLGPVESARVHLALPQKRLFKNQQKPATASVILKIRPGRTLAESQVQGIVHLVSGSVEGLSPDNVTIIDQTGRVLTRKEESGLFGAMSPDMIEYQLSVEQSFEQRAQALLDKALGPGNSMARVTAVLDFSRTEKTEEIFDPDEPVIRSEQVSEEKSTSQIVGGIPGVESNLQGNINRAVGATPSSSRSQRTTNYEISKTVSKTIQPTGTIKKISVGVLVADKIIPATDKEPARFEPRSEQELLRIENMISSALGLDPKRGDKIEIVSMPFTEKEEEAEPESVAANMIYQYMPLIRYGLILIGALLVYLLMVRPLIKTLRQDVTAHFKTVEELEAEQLAREREAEKAAREQEEQELAEIQRDPVLRIREEIMNNPVFAAHILKHWIHQKQS